MTESEELYRIIGSFEARLEAAEKQIEDNRNDIKILMVRFNEAGANRRMFVTAGAVSGFIGATIVTAMQLFGLR